MNVRTTISGWHFPFRIGHRDHILALGSCFAEHMGQLLTDHKFSICLNPFGILYNPLSMAHALKRLRQAGEVDPDELFCHQELWHHFAFHGRFSHPDKKVALDGMNVSLAAGQRQLNRTGRLILTLGTAFVFTGRKTGQVVANCHKLPGQAFERRRLDTAGIVDALGPVLEDLHADSPALEVLLSVSPVRHLRDGLVENQRSKASLILAADALCRSLPFVHYFPAYELFLDDLRDYRYCEADLTHPNDQAIAYIWSFFGQLLFDASTRELNERIGKLLTAARHRPFHPQIKSHQTFLQRQLAEVADLENVFPFLDFSREKTIFTSQIHPDG